MYVGIFELKKYSLYFPIMFNVFNVCITYFYRYNKEQVRYYFNLLVCKNAI